MQLACYYHDELNGYQNLPKQKQPKLCNIMACNAMVSVLNFRIIIIIIWNNNNNNLK